MTSLYQWSSMPCVLNGKSGCAPLRACIRRNDNKTRLAGFWSDGREPEYIFQERGTLESCVGSVHHMHRKTGNSRPILPAHVSMRVMRLLRSEGTPRCEPLVCRRGTPAAVLLFRLRRMLTLTSCS